MIIFQSNWLCYFLQLECESVLGEFHRYLQGVQVTLLLFSHSVVSDCLQTHVLQHASLPCLSTSPTACSNPCPLSPMPSNQLILCHPLLLLPSIFPSIKVFSKETVLCIRWPKYWSFSFSISPSDEYSELISFRTDLFDLLAVQGTLKSFLQHYSSKASIPP